MASSLVGHRWRVSISPVLIGGSSTASPVPPLAEQRRIVARLEVVQEKIRALKAAQAETDEKLKHLEQAILDKAFRGEL